mmetsp:Transcript_32297/g.55798  ORF Transcript_32297/g.55798 Transcript_32297/m.55798 type:complete len:101 (+) Transcript_32297:176-478(+)
MVPGILSSLPVLTWIRIDSIILLLRMAFVRVMKHVYSMVGHPTLARFSSSGITLVLSFHSAPALVCFINVALLLTIGTYIYRLVITCPFSSRQSPSAVYP